MFKNAFVYRLAPGAAAPTLTDLEARLAGASFVACGATERESAGWVPPRGDKHATLAESVGGQIVLKLCSETRAVPGGAVKARLEERLAQIEQQTGRRPKGRGAREIKDEVVHELLPRAFPKRSTTPVWLDPASGWALVGAASAKKADAVVTALAEAFAGGLTLQPLQTALAPATAMAAWLAEREAPSGFSIDRDCELKQPDSEKAAVRYARHTLDLVEVGEHIRQGKLPTQLALTWAGRVSFVLTEALALKRIKLLDVVLEGQDADKGRGDDGFDADVAIATGELRQLLPDLVAALGGEQVPGAAAG
ncbi:MAG: exonuclease [Rubrivivax sp. SCN 70-15]|nr:MAG: exonuclease [Rubrivivax sp. SCN 70-15]